MKIFRKPWDLAAMAISIAFINSFCKKKNALTKKKVLRLRNDNAASSGIKGKMSRGSLGLRLRQDSFYFNDLYLIYTLLINCYLLKKLSNIKH
jgi:hypothetical protein